MHTSRIIIVSRTKMGQYICVGAYDVDRHRNIRLLDRKGYGQPLNCPMKIGDVVTARYLDRANIEPPHTEDVLLQGYEPYANAQEVHNAFTQNASVVEGPLTDCFDGKLFQPGRGAMAIPNDDLPDHSVCFWRTDRQLTLNNFGKYVYRRGFNTIQIQYVGFPDAVQLIPVGTVVRLSLSRRWNMDGQEKLCWLQLSGWYGEL
ncbi:dual OB domain-containing protein [Cereibacter johrii]|uniref:dual OB domain-containing protein n=1 Tax=Cereibacter johrii TaxID=445629 RepID=UPI00396AA1F2